MMRTPQLFCIIGALAAATACNRAKTEAGREEAAAELRTAAVNAREKLADAWLVTKIQSQFFADDDVKARYVNVSARDGVVTLTGQVDSQSEHAEALQIARSTDGVRRLDDRLTIRSGSGATTQPSGGEPVPTTGSAPTMATAVDEAQVTAGVQSKFFVDNQVKSRQIDVNTRQGVVTLQGQVASESERAQALLLARTTEGVQRVEDHLTVDASVGSGSTATSSASGAASRAAAPPDDDTIVTTIQSKFFLDSSVKQTTVKVSSTDRIVVLEGAVPTETARQQAVKIARATDGVVQVVDRLEVKRALGSGR